MTETQATESRWAWGTAERGFKRALEISPGYATTYHLYSLLLVRLGRFDEAIAQAKRALAIDSFNGLLSQNLAYIYYLARRHDDAIRQSQDALSLMPDLHSARLVIIYAYLQKRMFREALLESQRAVADSGRRPAAVAALAVSEAALGNTKAAKTFLEELLNKSSQEVVSPYLLAWVYAATGDADKSLQWLERALEKGDDDVTFLKVDPALDSLRDKPRFQELLRRLNLPN